MPFDSALQSVYDGLIREVLEEVGYEVQRGDDLLSQRNILQDIIEAIERADLIVADLTDNNANVFYELGIAHTRMRPTILLTQSVQDVPFDLRSYRLIPYSTHFADVGAARATLREYAEAAVAGTLQFGSPVADYLRHVQNEPAPTSVAVSPPNGSEDDPRGFLDHSEALETGMKGMTEIMTEVTTLTERIGDQTREAGDAMTRSQQARGGSLPYGHLRRISTGLAAALEHFTRELASRNEQYRRISEEIEGSFEFLVRYASVTDEHQPERDEWLDVLETTKEMATQALAAYDRLAETMETAPPFEKSLIRSMKEASRQVRQMANNIRLTIASIDRALVAAGRA